MRIKFENETNSIGLQLGLPIDSIIRDLNEFSPLTKVAPKWVSLSNDNISLMQLLDVDVEMLKGGKTNGNSDGENFIPGEIYSISKESVEGVEFGRLYFRLYGLIKEYKGVNLDSLIVKEVSINDKGEIIEGVNVSGRRTFSMSPSMCKMMGIKYSPGFELWPINSGFEKVELKPSNYHDVSRINYGNMLTYPTSEIDGTIRKIIVELHGFSPFNNSHIITPTGALIPTNEFVSSLTIFARQNISTDNGCAGFKKGETLPFKIVSRQDDDRPISICDEKHNIYAEVSLTKQSFNVTTPDGIIGVSPTALDGKDIDDVIGVKWDESSDESNKNPSEHLTANLSAENIENVFKALDRHFCKTRFNRLF